MRIILLFALFIFTICMPYVYAQNVKYSPAWFGPNANPVPKFTDARIADKTTLQVMGDYYFGYGDETVNGYLKLEVPLLRNRISIKAWSSFLEHYQVSDSISNLRDMNGNTKGRANGDFYIQTRISILKERNLLPTIILNSTLKTASGTNFKERRYFDTPGYYFDMEIAKSIFLKNKILKEIRWVADIGFLCWETTNSVQNDALMYGGKLILGNEYWQWENTLAGYQGWMHKNPNYGSDYGDNPLIYQSKIYYKS
ncbi:MAG: hypothetical protein M0P14_08545, partial [Alkaliphilus sp.]|nr:hypothetical protein [Alkaliphilus sp.]